MNPYIDQQKQQPSNAGPSSLAKEFLDESPEHLAGKARKAYGDQVQKVRQDELVVQYLPLVHKIVSQVCSYLQPPLTRDDLVSAGTIGLVKAARDYDNTKEAEFKTYAYIRIRGAVIDELRHWSFTPPQIIKQYDQAQQFHDRVLEQTGEAPTDEQLAEELDMPIEKVYRMFEAVRAKHFLSIHGLDDDAPALGDCLAAENVKDPSFGIEQTELIEALAAAIQKLPIRQRRVIVLYYHKELTMKEIAEVLEITESRVSQLHASALFKLSVSMKKWAGIQEESTL